MNTLRNITRDSITYQPDDGLLRIGSTTYEYENGFLWKKTDTSVTEYDYSSQGELIGADMPDGRRIDYVHDPLGRRIAKKVDNVIVEKYLWQGMTRLLAVYNGDDTLLMRFEYADARMPFAMTKDRVLYYLAYDQVGSLRVVADGSGNPVKRIDYDSFGNIITETNPTMKIPFGFAGGLYDKDTKLVRFGYRDYDPDTGRWTAKDPIGFNGGDTDLYGYCVGDPVNLSDPSGLISGEKLKNHIKVSPGDTIGDKIMDIIKNKTLDAKTRNLLLKEIEQEIDGVCKGARKRALEALLKYAKAPAKYAAKYGLKLGGAAGIVLEAALPAEANDKNDVEMINERERGH